jgi:hypothetical protein
MAGEGFVTTTAAGSRAERLWALTAYFNPLRFRRRLMNYRAFRAHLHVPLIAVELAYGPDFELEDTDADILIRRRGRDVMWQKERLLNVALNTLPSTCDKVVWVDCDIVFEADDWGERLHALLDRFALVQAFSDVHHMSASWKAGDAGTSILFTQPSAVRAMASGTPAASILASRLPSGPGSTNKGLAWAARRRLLDKGGLYDACILGGGDLALVSAVYGCFEVAMRTMNDRQQEHYLAWARPWHAMLVAERACEAGFLDCGVRHLWHGDLEHRRYRERHDGLRPYDFDPFDDVAQDDEGIWRWSSDKPEMHDYVRSYFASRQEDG